MNIRIIRFVLISQAGHRLEDPTIWMHVKSDQNYSSPQVSWIKLNTDASKEKREQKTTIRYVCRGSAVCIVEKEGKYIRDVPVLVAETLVIRNMLRQAIKELYPKVIIESDSLIAVQVMQGESTPSKYIYNLVGILLC